MREESDGVEVGTSPANAPTDEVMKRRLRDAMHIRFGGRFNGLPANRASTARITGVYFLWDGADLVYIGQAVNVLLRVGQHLADKQFTAFGYYECQESELDDLEAAMIYLYNPPLNGYATKDGARRLCARPGYISDLVGQWMRETAAPQRNETVAELRRHVAALTTQLRTGEGQPPTPSKRSQTARRWRAMDRPCRRCGVNVRTGSSNVLCEACWKDEMARQRQSRSR